MYVPEGVVAEDCIVNVDVTCEPGPSARPALVNEVERPEALGEIVDESETVPFKPRLVKMTREVPDPPATNDPGETGLVLSRTSALTVMVKLT